MNDGSAENGAGRKILVVDDDGDTRLLIATMLAEIGHSNVVSTDNAASALQIILGGDVDLVLSDWRMPLMSGLELLEEVRKIDRSLPFILVTVMAERLNFLQALEAGVTEYLVKPFTIQRLSEKLEVIFP